jgi:ligand-binding sensor domain-containing protein
MLQHNMNVSLNQLTLFFVLFLSVNSLFSNNTPVPLGSWRIHLPYKNVNAIQETPDKIYCAGAYGMFSYDKTDGSTERLSPINGFGGYDVQTLAYDPLSNTLIIAYLDGKIEMVQNKKISKNDDIFNKTIVGAKTIYHINIIGDIAYLSTSFGLLEFNFIKNEIKNSYLNIGPNGTSIPIYSSCLLNDSVFISTDKGVFKGSANPNVNLGIFSNWFESKAALIQSRHIASFNQKIVAELDSQLYQYNNGSWTLYDPNSKIIVTNINVNHNKLVAGVYSKYILIEDLNGNKTNQPINVLNKALVDNSGNVWYSSPINGLALIKNGTELYFYPNGPKSNTNFAMVNAYEKLYVTAGEFTSNTYAPTFNGTKYYSFDNFSWLDAPNTVLTDPLYDFTHANFQKANNRLYIGTHGKGLLQMVNGVPSKVWDQTNSPLRPRAGLYTIISGLATDSRNNLWVSNFDVDSSLHMLTTSGTWYSYKPPTSRTGKILIDGRNNKWILTPQAPIGIIAMNDKGTTDPNDDVYVSINTNQGSGNLPSSNVNDIAFTKSGELLIGTDQGFVKVRNPSVVFNANVKSGDYDAQRVIVSVEANSNLGGYLLGSEVINCIVVDGGDRRWFGTNRGVWLYDSDGETLLKHFTKENSPLLSDNVTSIGIYESTGEVFFGTDMGICSYRSDAITPAKNLDKIVIYPNPVKPEYNGDIAITGLQDNTLVKITDINGNLAYQTYSNGGMATWNGFTFDGTKAVTGVYLVFCINSDGTQTQVGKLLFVH